MRGLLHRALLAAAAVAVILTAGVPTQAADVSVITAPQPRLAGSVDLPVVLPVTSGGPEDPLRTPTREIFSTLYLTDDLSIDSGLNTDLGRVLDQFSANTGAFDGLFYSSSALDSPYFTLSSGGSYIGANVALAPGLRFTLGSASSAPGLNPYLVTPHSAFGTLTGSLPFDARSTDSVLAGLTWNFAKWGGLGFTASRTTERGGAFGLSTTGLAGARTQAIGVTARVGLGGGWVTTASYSEGSTQLDLNPGAMAVANVRGESYGFAVAKHGLFGKNDALGVSFARPAPNFAGTFTSDSSDVRFFGRDKALGNRTPETDIELGYKTEFFGDSIALQANAAYQMNFGGQTGNNAVSLLSRAKIKF